MAYLFNDDKSKMEVLILEGEPKSVAANSTASWTFDVSNLDKYMILSVNTGFGSTVGTDFYSSEYVVHDSSVYPRSYADTTINKVYAQTYNGQNVSRTAWCRVALLKVE